MIFTPLVLGQQAFRLTKDKLPNPMDSIIDKTFEKILSKLEAYNTGDPQARKIVKDAMTNLVGDFVSHSVIASSKARDIARTLIQGIGYFVALGDPRSLAVSLGLAISDILEIPTVVATVIVGLFTKIVLIGCNQQTRTLRTEADDNEISGVLSALWQTISITFNIYDSAPKTIGEFVKTSINSINTCASRTSQLLSMFNIFIKAIYKMYRWCLQKIYKIDNVPYVLYHDKDLMKRWIDEVYTLIDPINEPSVLSDVVWHERLRMAVKVGVYLQKDINTSTQKDTPQNFQRLMDKLFNVYIKSINLGYATNIRREPVCIWISGAAGIGKTHMKDYIINHLLSTINISAKGDLVYTHTSGTKHWTGVKGKKVVLFDDFSTVEGDVLESDIADFMRLVSDARFCPDQAAVEDKGIPVAPYFVYVNCNESHPQYNAVRDKNAFLRRRHIVVEARLTKEFKARSYINLESDGARSWVDRHATRENPYPHLEFIFFDALSSRIVSKPLVFSDFISTLTEMFLCKYNLNEETYRQKLFLEDDTSASHVDLPFKNLLEQLDNQSVEGNLTQELKDKLYNTLSKIYDTGDAFLDGAKEVLASLTSIITTKKTEAPSSSCDILCTCDKRFIYNISKRRCIVYSDTGLPLKFCSTECIMKSADFWATVEAQPLLKVQRDLISLAQEQLGINFLKTETEAVIDIDEIRSVMQPVEEVPEVCSFKAKCLLALGMFVTATGCFYATYKYFKSNKRSADEPGICLRSMHNSELISSGDNNTTKLKKSFNGIKIKVPISQSFEAESIEDLEDLLDKNICYLVLNGIDRSSQSVVGDLPFRCLGYRGSHIIALKHYINKIKRTNVTSLRFIHGSGAFDCIIDMSKIKITYMKDSELVGIQLPLQVPNFRDISRHFITSSESSNLTNRARIYEKTLGRPGCMYDVSIDVKDELVYEDAGVPYTIPQALIYEWHNPGRCMSPIISCGRRNVIVALHICGGNGEGAGEPVVRESLDAMCSGTSYGTESVESKYLGDARPILELETQLVPEGITNNHYTNRPQSKSYIEPSLIHGYRPPTTRPAPLTQHDVGCKFSPLKTGVEKHGIPPTGFPLELIEKAKQYLREQYQTYCLPVRMNVGILTDEQAVLGIPGLDGYKSMELSTSEGFPYVNDRPVNEKSKRYQFEIEELEDGTRTLVSISNAVQMERSRKADLRARGIIPKTVFIDCLKDARISNEKFDVPGKTRIFSISPTDFTIDFRKYFGDLLASQKQHRFNMEHMVGMNIHSLEWTKLGRLLQSKGPKVLCGDYSNFGPSLDTEVVRAVSDVWCDWYFQYEQNEDNRRVRQIMMEEIRQSVHQCGNILYTTSCGAPSGAPCTVNLNNDVNKMYIYMAWLSCFKDDPMLCNLVSFRNNCVMFCYGDDIIINISDRIADKFNNVFLNKFFSSHGIKYTDATKNEAIVPYIPFSEASFLKAKWRPHAEHPTFFLPFMERSSIEDCANWIHGTADKVGATKQAILDSMLLAYGRGKEYYNKLKDDLIQAWSKRVVPTYKNAPQLCIYSYEDIDDIRFGDVKRAIVKDIDSLILAEQHLREQYKINYCDISLVKRLKSESATSEHERFDKAMKALQNKYNRCLACGIRVPAMEKILREFART